MQQIRIGDGVSGHCHSDVERPDQTTRIDGDACREISGFSDGIQHRAAGEIAVMVDRERERDLVVVAVDHLLIGTSVEDFGSGGVRLRQTCDGEVTRPRPCGHGDRGAGVVAQDDGGVARCVDGHGVLRWRGSGR